MKRRVLIVEDDADFAQALKDQLELNAYAARVTATTQQALDCVRVFEAETALIDIRLGRESGIDALRALKAVRPRLLCTLMTGYPSLETAIEAVEIGAEGYLRKPIDANELFTLLNRSFEIIQLRAEQDRTTEALVDRDRLLSVLRVTLHEVVCGTRAATSRTSLAIRAVDEAGRIIWVNDRHSELLGFAEQDVIGKSAAEMEDMAAEQLAAERVNALADGFSHRMRMPQHLAWGGTLWATVTSVPMFDRDGIYRGYCALIDDTDGGPLARSGDSPMALRARRDSPPLATLSPRQRQIVDAAMMGGTTDQMAEMLGISAHTVRNHLKAIYRKLHVSSRAELTAALTARVGAGS